MGTTKCFQNFYRKDEMTGQGSSRSGGKSALREANKMNSMRT